MITEFFAFDHYEDGQRWLRIWNDSEEWDEPLSDYEIVLDTVNGGMYYRNSKAQYRFKEQEVNAA